MENNSINNIGFNNINYYINEMDKSIPDKVKYFADHLRGVESFIDYGCADGKLLSTLTLQGINLYGIDINEEMIKRAKKQYPDITFKTGDIMDMFPYINYNCSAINFSSVLHEVYSYGNIAYIKKFWDRINQYGFKYIFVRDMLDINTDNKSHSEDELAIMKNYDINKIKEFEKEWGSLSLQKNLHHFLLKYRYIENWDREIKENYLSISPKSIKKYLSDDYTCIYRKEYILPFLKKEVYKDFGIEFCNPTHFQVIFKRNI